MANESPAKSKKSSPKKSSKPASPEPALPSAKAAVEHAVEPFEVPAVAATEPAVPARGKSGRGGSRKSVRVSVAGSAALAAEPANPAAANDDASEVWCLHIFVASVPSCVLSSCGRLILAAFWLRTKIVYWQVSAAGAADSTQRSYHRRFEWLHCRVRLCRVRSLRNSVTIGSAAGSRVSEVARLRTLRASGELLRIFRQQSYSCFEPTSVGRVSCKAMLCTGGATTQQPAVNISCSCPARSWPHVSRGISTRVS